MKKSDFKIISSVRIIIYIIFIYVQSSYSQDRYTMQLKDNGKALINPGMGWQLYHNDGPFSYATNLKPSDELNDFPGFSVVYMRVPWSYLEPKEGVYNWTVFDTPMQRWIERGKKVAFRVTACESSITYATPKWVRDAGAKGHEFKGVNSSLKELQWEPDYNDPIFLKKLDHFLQAFAERYDGDPDVSFVDIGSFGVWGECHTWGTSGLPYDYETVRKHIDLTTKHFKKTQLFISDDCVDAGRGIKCLQYARSKRVSLRDDSILVNSGKDAYYHDDLAQDFWLTMPVILETLDYEGLTPKWDEGKRVYDAIEDYHASQISIHAYPRKFLSDNLELIKKINMRLGYRLQLVEASWPKTYNIYEGNSIKFMAKWRNGGVAPCLPGGYPAITLKDDKDGIVAVFVDSDFNMELLPVDKPGLAEIRKQNTGIMMLPVLTEGLRISKRNRPHIKNGVYKLYISVGSVTGKPIIELPLDNDDGHKRYLLGEIKIVND